MASREDLKVAVREVLNEGTAQGQKNWAGTSKATLATVQSHTNKLNEILGDLEDIEDAQDPYSAPSTLSLAGIVPAILWGLIVVAALAIGYAIGRM